MKKSGVINLVFISLLLVLSFSIASAIGSCSESDGGMATAVAGSVNAFFDGVTSEKADGCELLLSGTANEKGYVSYPVSSCDSANCYVREYVLGENCVGSSSLVKCSGGCNSGACTDSSGDTYTPITGGESGFEGTTYTFNLSEEFGAATREYIVESDNQVRVWDFGGMFSLNFDNPLTGNKNCPTGYESKKIRGGGVSWATDDSLYMCIKVVTDSSSLPVAYFGGMYEDGNDNLNPITETAGCPNGYSAHKIYGGVNDPDMYLCLNNTVTPSRRYHFAGAESVGRYIWKRTSHSRNRYYGWYDAGERISDPYNIYIAGEVIEMLGGKTKRQSAHAGFTFYYLPYSGAVKTEVCGPMNCSASCENVDADDSANFKDSCGRTLSCVCNLQEGLSCRDSDGGKNYYVDGVVTVANSVLNTTTNKLDISYTFFTDALGNDITEYYCGEDGVQVSEEYDCSLGAEMGDVGAKCVAPCDSLLPKVILGNDFEIGGIKMYNDYSFSQEEVMEELDEENQNGTGYYALWFSETGEAVSYQIFVSEDINTRFDSWLKTEVESKICTQKVIDDNAVYVCLSSLGDKTSKHVLWAHDNSLIQVILYENSKDAGIAEIVGFISDLQDNAYKAVDNSRFEIVSPFLDILSEDLSSCESTAEKICAPNWQCRTEPAVCPPHGKQTETCVDVLCGNAEKKEVKTCTPGICSGCLLDNGKCIEYGFRFEYDSGEINNRWFVTGGDLSTDFGEYAISITSGETADFSVRLGTSQETTYQFGEGNSTVLALPGRKDVVYVINVNNIEYNESDPNNASTNYVDFDVDFFYQGVEHSTMNAYCDIDGGIKRQKQVNEEGDWAICQNNYECESNLCSSGECIEVQKLLAEASTYKSLFVRVLCRLAHMFNEGNYDTCVVGFLGPQEA